MTFMLKITAFILLALAFTTFTGIAHFSYTQPTETLLSFVFLSLKTAWSHGIVGIIAAVLVFFVIKKSIQLLLTMTLILTALAALLYYFW